MDPSSKILKLCDAWWNDHAMSKPVDIQKTGNEFIQLLGWTNATALSATESEGAWSVPIKSGATMAIHCLMPGALDSPTALVERGLDYCESTLMLVADAQEDGHDYMLATDFQKFFFYDAGADDLVLHADSPHFFLKDMLGELCRESAQEVGFDDIRREPRSYMARQLRAWADRTRKRVEAVMPGDQATGDRIIDGLLTLRFLYEHPVCETDDWSLRRSLSETACMAFEPGNTTCGESLLGLFRTLHEDWGMEAFALNERIAALLSNPEMASALMRDLALLSRSKFEVAAVLESFNYGEAAEKARVRLVPEPHEGRESFVATQRWDSLGEKQLELDVLEEGYRVIGHWADKLVAMHRRLEIENGVTGENQNGDVFHRVLDQSLRIWVDSPRQHRTARLMLILHLILCYENSGVELIRFPNVEAVCAPRPKILDVDKKQIYKKSNTFSGEWDAV